MDYSFPILILALTIYYAAKTIPQKNRALKESNRLLREYSKSQIKYQQVDETSSMMKLYLAVILALSAMMWVKDGTGQYLTQSIGLFMLVVIIIEVMFIDVKYRLFYNNAGFLYYGKYYQYKSVQKVGQSKWFFRLGKVLFIDNTHIATFKKALMVIQQKSQI